VRSIRCSPKKRSDHAGGSDCTRSRLTDWLRTMARRPTVAPGRQGTDIRTARSVQSRPINVFVSQPRCFTPVRDMARVIDIDVSDDLATPEATFPLRRSVEEYRTDEQFTRSGAMVGLVRQIGAHESEDRVGGGSRSRVTKIRVFCHERFTSDHARLGVPPRPVGGLS
jgi:hypothetical protein